MSDATPAATVASVGNGWKAEGVAAEHDLKKRGYQPIEGVRGIEPGARVRNRGEMYPAAILHGTSVVLSVWEKPDSAWARSYRRRDIEVVILRDRPQCEGMSRVGVWADYGTDLASTQGERDV